MNKKRIQQIKCLFTLFFVVCASFYATRSYAQNNAVTIRLSGVSMERVMNEIENQTNYLFLSNKDVDINSVVSVDVEARRFRKRSRRWCAEQTWSTVSTANTFCFRRPTAGL